MRKFNLILVLLAFAFVLVSCGGDDDSSSTNPTPTTPAGDTPPTKPNRDGDGNSTLKSNEFTNGGNTFKPVNQINSVNGRHNIGKLTQNSRKSSGGKVQQDDYAWLVDEVSVNGDPIDFIGDPDLGLDLAFFFLEDGTYDAYDFANDEWYWGYWYATENADILIFDPDTEFELIFDINGLNNTSMSISLTDDEDNTFDLELNAYSEGEGEFTDDIDVETLENYVVETFWELEGFGYYDADGSYVYDEGTGMDLTAYFEDSEMFLASQEGDFNGSTGENAPILEVGTYSFDVSNFILTLTYFDNTTEDLYLVYADDEVFILALEDEDLGYIEFVFTPVDQNDALTSISDYPWTEIATYDPETDETILIQEGSDITFNSDGTLTIEDATGSVLNGNYAFNPDAEDALLIDVTGEVQTTLLVLFYTESSLVLLDLVDEDITILY